MSETAIAALLCGLLSGGVTEQSHDFTNLGAARRIRVDCETDALVIEVGLDDKASARDSLHQALFAAELTGKRPVVILIDRDGQEGRYEYEMRRAAPRAGVSYLRCPQHAIERWRATQPFRAARGDDVPRAGPMRALCDLASLLPGTGS